MPGIQRSRPAADAAREANGAVSLRIIGRHSVKSLTLQGTIFFTREHKSKEMLMEFFSAPYSRVFYFPPAVRPSQASSRYRRIAPANPAHQTTVSRRYGRIYEEFPEWRRIAIDADSTYETFSVIKIPIMAEVFHQAGAGKLSLDERITLKSGDQRLPSGILYSMQPGLNPHSGSADVDDHHQRQRSH